MAEITEGQGGPEAPPTTANRAAGAQEAPGHDAQGSA